MKKLLTLITVILTLATAPLFYSVTAKADEPAETKVKTLIKIPGGNDHYRYVRPWGNMAR